MLGSIYGCSVGVGCMANTECIRKKTQFLEYGHAPVSAYAVAMGLPCVVIVCMVIGCCTAVRARQAEHNEVELTMPMEPAARNSDDEVRRSFLARVTPRCVGCRHNRRRLPTKRACLCCSSLLVLAVLLSCVLVLHWPRQPIIDYCNKEMYWSVIANDIALAAIKSHISADFEQLLSAYNPNRVDLTIESVAADLEYPPESGQKIGSMTISNWTIPAGSVADALATISLTVSKWDAFNLAKVYREGALKIGVIADVDFKLRAYGFRVIKASFSMGDMVIDTAAPSDTTYCTCEKKNDTAVIDTRNSSTDVTNTSFENGKSRFSALSNIHPVSSLKSYFGRRRQNTSVVV